MTLTIETPYITLSAALKLAGLSQSGGEAKLLVAQGHVYVNGKTCTMRGKKLYPGDEMSLGDWCAQITAGTQP